MIEADARELSKRDGEKVEVYIMGEVDKVQGLAIIAANPRELILKKFRR